MLGNFGCLVSQIVNFTSSRDSKFMINLRMALLNFNKRWQKVSIVAWNWVRLPQYDLVVTGSNRGNNLFACGGKVMYIPDPAVVGVPCTG